MVLNRNLEWSVAGPECRSLHKDAHLVIINDAQEQAAVAQLLASIASIGVSVHSVLVTTLTRGPSSG